MVNVDLTIEDKIVEEAKKRNGDVYEVAKGIQLSLLYDGHYIPVRDIISEMAKNG